MTAFKTMKNNEEQPIYLRNLRSDFEPPPSKNCTSCNGHAYTIHAEGEFAFAKPCSCVPLCTRCGGAGSVSKIDLKGTVRFGRCRCQKLPDRADKFRQAKIPARYGKYSFGEFDFEKIAYSATFLLSTWIIHFNPKQANGFILTGGVGRGKTHLMIATCKHLITQYNLSLRFIEFSRLLADLRHSFSKKQSTHNLMEELVNVDILAIDEIGKGRCSDWELSIIDELISRRYNAMKIIVGTTNYPWGTATGQGVPILASEEFKQTLGDRIGQRAFSRLMEATTKIEVGGTDYRAQGTELDTVINPQLRL